MSWEKIKAVVAKEVKTVEAVLSAAAGTAVYYADQVASGLTENMPALQPYLSPTVVQVVGGVLIGFHILRGVKRHAPGQP